MNGALKPPFICPRDGEFCMIAYCRSVSACEGNKIVSDYWKQREARASARSEDKQ